VSEEQVRVALTELRDELNREMRRALRQRDLQAAVWALAGEDALDRLERRLSFGAPVASGPESVDAEGQRRAVKGEWWRSRRRG
jgi:hypothetical protein